MATNLSKDWTLSRLLGILRITSNEIAPDKLQDLELIDILHLAICDIAELLGPSAYRDYGKRIKIFFQIAQPTQDQTGDIWIDTDASNKQWYYNGTAWTANSNAATLDANVIDLSNHKIGSIIKLVDDVLAASSVNALCPEVDQKEFDGIYNVPQKQNSVFFTRFGQRIYFVDGTSLAARSVPYSMHLFYNRVPEKVTVITDTVDIRDKYMKLVVDKAKIMIFENLHETAPESLTNTVNSSVQLIRQANMSEFDIVKNRAKLEKKPEGRIK